MKFIYGSTGYRTSFKNSTQTRNCNKIFPENNLFILRRRLVFEIDDYFIIKSVLYEIRSIQLHNSINFFAITDLKTYFTFMYTYAYYYIIGIFLPTKSIQYK